MPSYTWKGSVLSIDFKEDGRDERIELDSNALADSVKEGCLRLGLKTALRNATAGKMDDVNEGFKAMKAKADLFAAGVYEKEGTRAEKVELDDDERETIIAQIVVKAKKANPNEKRDDEAIIKAFNALPDEKRSAALASLDKLIKKALSTALAEKKKLKKVDGGNW